MIHANSATFSTISDKDEMNRVTALFFAALRDRVGVKSVEIQIPAQTKVSDLETILLERFPSTMNMLLMKL